MVQVNCNIKIKEKTIYVGDLVTYKGELGLVCEVVDDDDNEAYCIIGFDGRTLKHYKDDYLDIDVDGNVSLVCARNDLMIDISKKGE